jgi:glycyl-tRNA synthetase
VKKEGLPEIAQGIAKELCGLGIEAFYDESGSVGRRYRRQDEIGTPWCITVDFDSLTDKTVTLRDRDSMKQERIAIDKVSSTIYNNLK